MPPSRCVPPVLPWFGRSPDPPGPVVLPWMLIVHGLILVLLAGCGGSMTTTPPAGELPARFSASGASTTPERWWLALNDPTLHHLIDRALEDNPGLLATWARLAQARHSARREAASLTPVIDASASAGTSARDTGREPVSLGLGLSASYEVDLWGGIDAARDAAAIQASASAADLKAAAITLSAEVATTYFDLVQARRELELFDELIGNAERLTGLVQLRFRAGLVPETDLLQQTRQTENLRGERELSIATIEVLENRLGVLLGEPPGTILPRGGQLASLPPLPDTGLPADLIGRRPDVHSRYLAIQVADRSVAVAAAARLPSLRLSASASSTGTVHELFTSFIANLVGGLTAPLIDGGRRRAELERSREALIERVHLYREAVLRALSEVEDALVREQQQVAYLERLDTQLELARQVASRTELAYGAGAADYLSVLQTQSSLQEIERRNLSARRTLLGHRIALYRALAGGWAMSRPG